MLLSACALALIASAGCDRTVTVSASPAGAQKLALSGDKGVEGTLSRPLKQGATTLPVGTRVRVLETWLLRKDKSTKPPGYRISGLYDPTVRTDGLMLPRHSVDAYYFAAVLPDAKREVAVPAHVFTRARN